MATKSLHNPFDVSQDAGRPLPRGMRTALGLAKRRTAPRPVEKIDEERDVVVTPSEAPRHLTDRLGRRYIRVRCAVKFRNANPVDRTVMIQGLAFEIFDQVLRMGASFRIRGLRTHVRDEAGEPTGEYYRAFQILKIFEEAHGKGREIDGETGEPVRKLAGHAREGHYKRQHFGRGGAETRIIWVEGYDVNGGRLDDDAETDLQAMFG